MYSKMKNKRVWEVGSCWALFSGRGNRCLIIFEFFRRLFFNLFPFSPWTEKLLGDVLHSMCKFFIEPPPDTQRKERQGTKQGERERKRNMGCCALLSVAHSPPPPPPPLPHLARHFTCPWPGLSGLEGQGRAPPPYPSPFWTIWGCSGRSRGWPLILRS